MRWRDPPFWWREKREGPVFPVLHQPKRLDRPPPGGDLGEVSPPHSRAASGSTKPIALGSSTGGVAVAVSWLPVRGIEGRTAGPAGNPVVHGQGGPVRMAKPVVDRSSAERTRKACDRPGSAMGCRKALPVGTRARIAQWARHGSSWSAALEPSGSAPRSRSSSPPARPEPPRPEREDGF